MARWLVPAGLLLLATAWLLHTTGALPFGEPPADADDPLAALEAEEADQGTHEEGGGPMLSAAAAQAARARAEAERARDDEARGPTGPYELTFIDADTLAPLDAVELRDMDDETIGATNEKGVIVITDAGVEVLYFRALLPGYVAHAGAALPDEPQEVALYPGIAIQARLVRGAGDEPVPNATVRVWDEDLGREVVATGTDAEGGFRLRAVRPHHPLVFVVNAPDLVPHVHRMVFDQAPVQPWLLRMPEGNRIEGRVFEASGKPRPKTTVWLMPPSRRPLDEHLAKGRRSAREGLQARDLLVARTATTVTDDEGRYAFEGVAPRQRWQPAAFPGRRHVVRGDIVAFADHGETRTVDLTLGDSATLRLTVRERLGGALSHAEISISTREGRVALGPGDAWKDGSVTITGLTPGRIGARAVLPGRPAKAGSVKVPAGGEGRIDLLFERGGELKGRVRDEAGAPIWQARVQWLGYSPRESVEVRADQHGRFHLLGLKSSSGMLRVSARDLPHTRTTYETYTDRTAKTGGEAQEITLKGGTAVIGRFPDLDPGTTLRCRMIAVGETSDWTIKLDEQGAFRRDGPDVDRGATFVFYLRGMPPLIEHSREKFRSGEVRNLGSLAFLETNPRRGKVVGPGGRPLHGAKVSIVAPWTDRTTRTDTDGDFVLARLPGHRLKIRIEADDLPPHVAWFEASSQFRRAVFRMAAGRHVTVTVVDMAGKPLPRAQVMARPPHTRTALHPPPETVHSKDTDRKGQAKFWLPAGVYEFHATIFQGTRLTAMKTVNITPPKKGAADSPQAVEVRLGTRGR